jgi:hypothetical protein
MGVAELIVALCLQAEPSSCRIIHRRQIAPMTGCAVIEDAEEAAPRLEEYRARLTCGWRG